MLRKTTKLLIENPSILIIQLAYLVASFLSSFLFDSIKHCETSSMNDYFIYCGKFLIPTVIGLLLGMIFIAGFGNAISEAITTGKSDFISLFIGIKKDPLKSMLSVLVLYIIYGLFSSVLFPAVAQIIMDTFVPYDDFRITFYHICIYIISIFIMPFTSLFLPAVFIDQYDVMAGLIMSMKLALRNYKKLLLAFVVIYIPIIVNVIFIKDSVLFVFIPLSMEHILNPIEVMSGNAFSISVIIMYLLEAAIFLVTAPLFFVIYKDSSMKRLL